MIVIPMVGRSSRFFKAGFVRPKYELSVGKSTVFAHAVGSFAAYFETDFFLFLIRNDYGAHDFVKAQIAGLGIRHYQIVVFDHETRGQAETVYQGLQKSAQQGPLYIFNIDTFRPDFRKPVLDCDGYLEVFAGEGDHWSFVLPGDNGRVLRTTEKERISDLCSDGLYYFRDRALFDKAFSRAVAEQALVRSEYYIAPLYNYLIEESLDVRFVQIPPDDVIFCGTPEEYSALCRWA